jgi:hypothetical protein
MRAVVARTCEWTRRVEVSLASVPSARVLLRTIVEGSASASTGAVTRIRSVEPSRILLNISTFEPGWVASRISNLDVDSKPSTNFYPGRNPCHDTPCLPCPACLKGKRQVETSTENSITLPRCRSRENRSVSHQWQAAFCALLKLLLGDVSEYR